MVKWSACSLADAYSFSVIFVIEKNENKEKEAWVGAIKNKTHLEVNFSSRLTSPLKAKYFSNCTCFPNEKTVNKVTWNNEFLIIYFTLHRA